MRRKKNVYWESLVETFEVMWPILVFCIFLIIMLVGVGISAEVVNSNAIAKDCGDFDSWGFESRLEIGMFDINIDCLLLMENGMWVSYKKLDISTITTPVRVEEAKTK